jgi:DNA-binding MarR family transcriptional regulator
MIENSEPDRVKEFLGSAHIFARAISAVVERKLLQDSVGGELSVEQMPLLKLVGIGEAHTIGDVAAFLEIGKAAASKTVDKLARRALLSRSQSETDRRSIKLSLTESSRRLLALHDVDRERKLAAVFSEASPEELHRMSELLQELSIRIVKQSSPPGKVCLQCGIYLRENCSLRDILNQSCFHEQKPGRKSGYERPAAGAADTL